MEPVGDPVDSIGPIGPNELHVMTFNVRVDHDGPPHSWPERHRVIERLLTDEQPHVLGTQECLYHQVRDVARALPQRYEWIGMGREGGSRDEFLAIHFDTTRLEPVEFDHFWLSETPSVVGSRSWDTRSVRMVTWVRFTDRRTGRDFVVVNTHLDDGSETARIRGAELVARTVGGFADDVPLVVTGDFNANAETSTEYNTLTMQGHLVDTWLTCKERGRFYASYHGYGTLREEGDRIDWILASPDVTTRASMLNPIRDPAYPSDHLPYQAVIRLP
ncbi:MAG: endonuclease [Acidimicrobiia bacterium]|nr:endonuclease [Acidimicrobiia bacterium]